MKVAALDIGTNSVRLLVAEASEGGLRPLERRVVVTHLGEGVDRSGRLGEAGTGRTLEVLAGYAVEIAAAGVARVRAVATSAVRDAADRAGFLGRAEQALGVGPEVISGEEEAALSFRGATGGLSGDPPYLVIDPGGGSTEFVFGTGAPAFSDSVDLGSRRLTERLLADRPAPPGQLVRARALAAERFARVRLPDVPGTVVGVGGTCTALAAIGLDLPAYDRDRVHGSRLTLGDLEALVSRLAGLTVAETAAIPSLDPARAPVLLGGAIVAAEALRRSGRTELVVSEADLLDGIALGLGERA